mmetsp:Transcript_2974/g.4510  ORF Transcript_2974/g.4510 Transcript_2974/m.4510 type:complete len:630 (-) Transcript_2974:4-1893(-)
MSRIVEVKVCSETLLISCPIETTISELGERALVEYEQAYFSLTNRFIQLVRDSQGRILSGSIQLKDIDMIDFVEVVVCDDDNGREAPVDLQIVITRYFKWQESSARQVLSYMRSMRAKCPPCKEALVLLENMSGSTSTEVQSLALTCFGLILEKCENAFLLKIATDGILRILRTTGSGSVAVSALKQLVEARSQPDCTIDTVSLVSDATSAVKRFAEVEAELTALCETLGTSGRLAHERRREIRDSSPRKEENAPVQEKPVSPLSGEGGGMSLERVLELLHSSDPGCREFALEKVVAGVRGDGPSDGLTLLRAVFQSLKASLRPPRHQPSRRDVTAEAPMPYLVADGSLRSSDTHLRTVQLSLQCAKRLVIELLESVQRDVSDIGADLESILSERWRLLLTLSHAHPRRDEDVCGPAAEILLVMVAIGGWEKFGIWLEKESVDYFLTSEWPLPRTRLALDFLVHCAQVHESSDRKRLPSTEREVGPALIDTLCANDYRVLRSVWKWAVGSYTAAVTVKATQVLSGAVIFGDVKSFFVKFNAIDKLLHVLNRESDIGDSSSADRSQFGFSTITVQCILKILANLLGFAPESVTRKIREVFSDTMLQKKLEYIADYDEVVSFYLKLLAIHS